MAKKIDIYKERKEKLKIDNPKKVSVIIPNYNYQDFIIERIDSILMQTYPIYELIILDDCSTDNSVSIIKEKISKIKDINVSFVQNDINSGVVFKQWQKGFSLAKGDYVWIAEADDSAENDFVENLMKGFEDKDVVLSYCESSRIDENNLLIREKSDDLYDMCHTGEWNNSFIKEGKKEIIDHISVTNTILNVSSVMWKKQDYSKTFEEATKFKVAGDWYIYYQILKDGKISFCNKPLNYYRKHSRSVCTTVKTDVEFEEICKIQDEISEQYDLPKEIKEKQELRRTFMYPIISENVIKDYRNKNPRKGNKRIAWVIPHPGKGSGGHRTIIQNVNALIRKGYECDIYVEEDNVSTAEMVKQKINEYYEPCSANVYVGIVLRKEYDIIFATGWQIVEFVRKLKATKEKAYFIQDFEPWFFPMGDQYLITENSYRYGYKPVTIGKWLANKMQQEYNTPAQYFDFGADLKVYHKLENIEKENAICFVYQPEKSRRCDYIGLKALKIVKALKPDLQIYLYGSNFPATFEFECKNLNIIPLKECNKLYNRCKVGICMSASNPSRIPFEMMAAGLPVVELYKENNLYDLPDEGVILARPTPEAIASAIIHLLDNPEEREKMSKFGINYMKDYPLEKGFEQFLKAVDDMLNTQYNSFSDIQPTYKKPAFESTEEARRIAISETPQINIDNKGSIYRFLRRVKRKLREILVKMRIKK